MAFLFALGVLIIWLPPRPPMVDLPQHAGQIGLLRDLILHRSPWAHEVRINLFTPYLIGYGLALPLAFVMPVAAAIKLVLTAAYAAFVGLCRAIGQRLGAPHELDAYYVFPFFGFAYAWGLYTFLIAAPLGLALVLLSMRYAREGGRRIGLTVAALGLLLVVSHGLVCVLACGVGLGLVVARAASVRAAISRASVFVAPLALCALFALASRSFGVRSGAGPIIAMGALDARFILDLSDSLDDSGGRWPVMVGVALLALPIAAGLKLDWRRRESLIIAGGVFAAVALAPLNFGWIGAIYTRFGLFLFPAWAWLFRSEAGAPAGVARIIAPRLGLIAQVIAATVLTYHAARTLAFRTEATDFEVVAARAAPAQQALTLTLDQGGSAVTNRYVYMHFPQWYQADKHGFVDFNFAVFPSQVVRLVGLPPPVDADGAFEWSPGRFDWRRYDGNRYRYFFVRKAGPVPSNLFAGAPRPPVLIARGGAWSLYENRPRGAGR